MLKYWTLSSLNGRCSKAVFIKYCFSFFLRDIVHVEKKNYSHYVLVKRAMKKATGFLCPKQSSSKIHRNINYSFHVRGRKCFIFKMRAFCIQVKLFSITNEEHVT